MKQQDFLHIIHQALIFHIIERRILGVSSDQDGKITVTTCDVEKVLNGLEKLKPEDIQTWELSAKDIKLWNK